MKDDKLNIDNLEHITHDGLFQVFFGVKNVAIDFLRSELPPHLLQQIDLDSMTKEDTSFVSTRFTKSFLDIMYSGRFGHENSLRICFLFEHKSRQPGNIYLQILDYMLQIWEDHIKQAKANKQLNGALPLIIPIIVHHGKGKWVMKPFHAHFGMVPSDFLPYIPHFEYLLKDLTATSKEDLLSVPNDNLLRNLFFALKFAFNPGALKDNLQLVFAGGSIKQEEDGSLVMGFIALFNFILQRGEFTEQEFLELKETVLNNNNADVIMSTYDQIVKKYKAEGEAIGVAKGEAIGEAKVAQTKREFVISLLGKFPNMVDAELADLAKVDEAFVRELREGLKVKK